MKCRAGLAFCSNHLAQAVAGCNGTKINETHFLHYSICAVAGILISSIGAPQAPEYKRPEGPSEE